MDIQNIRYNNRTIKEIVNNIEEFFNTVKEDCINPYNFEIGNHLYNLLIGYDMFTITPEGDICNSSKDTRQYYIELYENFFEEEGFEPGSDGSLETIWLNDFDKSERTEALNSINNYILKLNN